MQDNNNTNDNQNNAPVNGSSEPYTPVFMEETLPPMPQGEIKQEKPTTENKEVKEETKTEEQEKQQKKEIIPENGSAAPQDGSMMPPTIPGKKKMGKGKIVATILGLVLLLGGIGTGVYLVGENQDIREEAYETDSTCEAKGMVYCGGCIEDCVSYEELGPRGCSIYIAENCDSYNIPQPTSGSGWDADLCDNNGCSSNGRVDCIIFGYQCDRNTNLDAGCGDREGLRSSTTSLSFVKDCGSEQIDIQCDNGTSIVKDYASRIYSHPCGSTVPPPSDNPPATAKPTATTKVTNPPSETCSCLNIKAYDTNWNLLTASQLSTLKAGDEVRFVVTGSASSGTFDKARFKINGTPRPEVTNKKPGSQNAFYDSFIIPEGTFSFTVNAEIHNNPLGWR